ncbi:MAG: PAS domain S-box protein [Steroidobacteraceae bacterium]|nr:PAS domain S-box protein [Deltaproteobacteria bacterium]
MQTNYYNQIKRKYLFAGGGGGLVLAGLFCWHAVTEYRLATLANVGQKETLASWYATIYVEALIGGLLILLVATLFFLFLRQIKKLEFANLKLLSQQEELQFKAELIDSASDAILLLDEKGGVIQFNNAFCKITGRSRPELDMVNIQDLKPAENAGLVEERIQQILKNGEAVFESVYRHVSGTNVSVEVHARSVDIGHRQLVLGVLRDISEQKALEKTLQKVASEWRDTFDSVEDVVWLLDMNRRIIRANKATQKLFNKLPMEVVGLCCCEIGHDDLKQHHACPFNRMMESKKRASIQMPVADKWFEVSVDPVLSADGVVYNAVHIIKDITAIKSTELRERVRAEILERIAGGDPLPQLLTFIALAIEKECPEALCSIMLVDEEGERLTTGAAPSLPEAYNMAVNRTRIGEGIGSCGTAAFRRERVVAEDIDTHPFWKGFIPAQEAGLRSCWSEPIFSSVGQLLGTFAIYHRIPAAPGEEEIGLIQQAAAFAGIAIERSKNELEREQLENLLSQSQKMEAIGHLAGGVAHDFNNLLTPIIIYSDMLKRALPDDEKLQSKIDGIIMASHKARDLTQQLLSFGRKQVMQMQVQDLNEIIMSFFSIMRRALRENIDLKLQLAVQPAMVRADRSKIEQVLLNLAINAQDAISENGVISIDTGHIMIDDEYARLHPGMKTGYYIQMSFSDNGCGMGDETMRHIFEPFFTTKQVGHGTGLGLANVYGIVKQHNAYISALSRPGNGTTFKVYFPLTSEQPNVVKPQLCINDEYQAGVETILLVEDNEMVRAMSTDLLEGLGYTVLVADHPARALEIARQATAKIDLVITDVVMPGMNGRQLFEQLTTDHPEIDKVLFMSGYTNNVIVTDGVLEEGLHFLQKPFTADAMMAKVRDLLHPVL